MSKRQPQPEFPGLSNLMNTWLNQDYDIHGDTDEERLLAYALGGQPTLVQPMIDEIDRFLRFPVSGLLDRYRRETGQWNMLIGETDEQARDWLVRARETFASVLAEGKHG